jgi:hypothetical protein
MIGYPQAGMQIQSGAEVQAAEAVVAQRWPEVDLAALAIPNAVNAPLTWDTRDLLLLDAVSAAGYPFALDTATSTVAFRAFAGHIVGKRPLPRFSARPACYEVSFPAPRGLSGSALLHAGAVIGCVIGNESMRMDVFREAELLDEGVVTSRVERYEGLSVGLAVRADVILALRFNDGRTVLDHVRAVNGRIIE